jgi:anti-anti-sigma factor
VRIVPDHGSLPGFEIAVAPATAGVRVTVAGELDIATAAQFEATLLEQLAEGPVRLDLRGLSFMDSTGIRILDAILRELPMIGTTLLVDPTLQPAVRQILVLTGMLDALPFDAPPAPDDPPA